jgi:class 3 adenylate cyclase
MNKDTPIHAVLTGDLVGSRRLAGDQVEALFQHLNDLWGQFADCHAGAVVGRIEVFRGDGWQAALAQPSLAVKAALFLRAVVKAQPFDQTVDTRVGIGIGRVDLKSHRLPSLEAIEKSSGVVE